MSEEKFWHTAPRKFHALLDAHIRANTPKKETKSEGDVMDPKAAVRWLQSW